MTLLWEVLLFMVAWFALGLAIGLMFGRMIRVAHFDEFEDVAVRREVREQHREAVR